MGWKLALASIAAAIALPAPVLADQSSVNDPRAIEAVQLFNAFCVKTAGDKTTALAVLGYGNPMARRLPDQAIKAIQGQDGGVGWAIRSPSDAQLLLAYNPMGICEVRIAEADQAAVVSQFDAIVNAIAAKTAVERSVPEARVQDDANLTFRTATYALNGRKAVIAMTTSDKRIGEQQHLITFGFVS